MAADFLKVDYLFLAVGVVGGACSDVEQLVLEVNQFSKRDQLLEILKTTGMVLPAGPRSSGLFSVITFCWKIQSYTYIELAVTRCTCSFLINHD